MGQTRMYECHGGPWDGEVRAVHHGTTIEIDRGPWPDNALIVDPNKEPSAAVPILKRRIGLYVKANYRPLGSKEMTTVLLWEGEEIR